MDILIIGGGAAGFFAAITAAETYPEARVHILEQGPQVLGKVKVSGGGRCNVTHACFEPKALVEHYPRGGQALLGPFHRFMTGDTMAWFEARGVPLKIEADGRVFPVSDRSQSIIDCLMSAAETAGVQVSTRSKVTALRPPNEANGTWQVVTAQQVFSADRVLLASGSNPATWDLLQELGHQVETPVPSLFTFNVADHRLAELPGVAVADAEVQVEGSKLQASGPLLVTHWGLSGPGVLRLSAWGARELHQRAYDFDLRVNWQPGQTPEDWMVHWQTLRQQQPKKQVVKSPQGALPARLWQSLCAQAGIPSPLRWAELTRMQAEALANELAQGQYAVRGKSTFKEEFVTCGGVSLREVDFRRMASKRLPGLFFAGEVLDIDAITGGFNFQAAWTTGWIAGHAMGAVG
jgi:hypothetical protein